MGYASKNNATLIKSLISVSVTKSEVKLNFSRTLRFQSFETFGIYNPFVTRERQNILSRYLAGSIDQFVIRWKYSLNGQDSKFWSSFSSGSPFPMPE